MRDVIQLIFWAVFGFFITWGIYFAYVGFRQVPSYKNRRLAKTASTFALVIGIIWIMFWVSAVIFNAIQIAGGTPWPLEEPR